MLRQATAGTKL